MKRPTRRLPRLRRRPPARRPETASPEQSCPVCHAPLAGAPLYQRHRVCDVCGYHERRGARASIAALVDAASFHETDALLGSADPLGFHGDRAYVEQLADARRRTGEADAIVTGDGAIGGHPVVVVALDFSFLGGSMGVVVGEKIVRAAERARKERRPLITIAASGGARMQEGMLSLLQMAKTAAAMERLRSAGVLHVAILTNPTTGGVYASFASLADVIVAEPAALIGFAGPRVAEQAIGRKMPPGSHSAEAHLRAGAIDAVVDRRHHRSDLTRLLDIVGTKKSGERPIREAPAAGIEANPDPWDTVQAARDPERPTARAYIDRMFESFVELHGDRLAGDDPSVIVGLGLLEGRAVGVIGLDRSPFGVADQTMAGHPLPEGYRKAARLLRLAERLQAPVISLIDTPGAWPGIEAEQRGLANALAESLALMAKIDVPTIAAVVGEGGSGGALALAAADLVLMQQNAIYSVISPEGAATILYRDSERAPEIARALRLTAADLRELGIVDAIVPEPAGGSAADAGAAATLLRHALLDALEQLERQSLRKRRRERERRYRAIGRDFIVNVPWSALSDAAPKARLRVPELLHLPLPR
ncbi:MAG TPA: carboxyl transferase domain-containing protein, partial [Thermomicrobiales bacterium]|nr:carboxyl transferase domain-containing protein [Thermomicrobiales bacterium]